MLSLLNSFGKVACLAASLWISITVLAEDKKEDKMKIEKSDFGVTPSGQKVSLFTLTNSHGNTVQLTNYGAIIVSINVPGRDGKPTNINAGFDKLEGYLERHPYFGATVGRFCNRIAKGKFSIEGKEYSLAINNGPNHLHGGEVGFDKLVWDAEEVKSDNSVAIRFHVLSPDGQEGYPGNLDTTAIYSWDNDNRLSFQFLATTDKPTVLNLTNHAYMNLGGPGSGKVTEHQLQISSDKYLAVDDTLIPTGQYTPVEGTPLDFRKAHAIGERISQLVATSGYDHCFVLNGEAGKLRPCAIVVDPKSGRALEITTTQPAVQLYTGNHLGGTPSNAGYKQHEAFCLETQHYPDAPNKPEFPTTLLKPGQKFDQTTVFRFYTVP